MNKKFDFVIGCLPRSGSAWLANALNLHPDILCLHEGVGRPYTYNKASYSYVGSVKSDAFLLTDYEEGCQYYYIDRGETYAAQSLAKAGVFSQERWTDILRVRDAWVGKFNPEFLNYNDLDLAVGKIVGGLLYQYPVDNTKLALARDLRVTSLLYPDSE